MDVEQLRTFALSLPHATEDIKWEVDLCFCIGAKMFCVTGLEQPTFRASFKVLDEEFDEISGRPGIKPAPYVARYKWVQVYDRSVLSDDEWKHYVKQSYDLVKSKLPKKVLKEMGET